MVKVGATHVWVVPRTGVVNRKASHAATAEVAESTEKSEKPQETPANSAFPAVNPSTTPKRRTTDFSTPESKLLP